MIADCVLLLRILFDPDFFRAAVAELFADERR